MAESHELLGEKGKDMDIKTVLQPNATIGVVIGLICLIMPFRERSKQEKSGKFACEAETFL